MTFFAFKAQASDPDLNVLVVEDEYFIATEIAEAFAEAGAEVIGPVPSLEEGLRLLASGSRIDAAVLDINLRGRMIFELAQVLQDRKIPFIFATGYEPAIVPEAFASVPLFQKPFDAAALVAALKAPFSGSPADMAPRQ